MTIHLYTLCWNEADLLPFFFRHYDSWVDRYVIYDDGSDDGSLEILARHPKVEVRRFTRSEADSFVLSHKVIHNEVWKESRGRADWVVITALDEHLELAGGGDQRAYLDACRREGVTLVLAVGYQMLSWRFPSSDQRLASTIVTGAPYPDMCKLSIFDPARITSPGFGVGRHFAEPTGDLVYPKIDRMTLRHYKYVGLVRTYRRQRALSVRLGKTDIARRWGRQYFQGPLKYAATVMRYRWKAINLSGAEPDGAAPGHKELPLWWRGRTRT